MATIVGSVKRDNMLISNIIYFTHVYKLFVLRHTYDVHVV